MPQQIADMKELVRLVTLRLAQAGMPIEVDKQLRPAWDGGSVTQTPIHPPSFDPCTHRYSCMYRLLVHALPVHACIAESCSPQRLLTLQF
jgi:hypothetical protein